ncbi:hypothetical protein Tco_0682578 [Tanacetum coccineum]|uniref:Uncharacterized protein n=1 Tax=Tanacetum coccineum TaxID=301880 RepID=A0ABQ4XTF9_9ASTR
MDVKTAFLKWRDMNEVVYVSHQKDFVESRAAIACVPSHESSAMGTKQAPLCVYDKLFSVLINSDLQKAWSNSTTHQEKQQTSSTGMSLTHRSNFCSLISWTSAVSGIQKAEKYCHLHCKEADTSLFPILCSILWIRSQTTRLMDLRSTKFRCIVTSKCYCSML